MICGRFTCDADDGGDAVGSGDGNEGGDAGGDDDDDDGVVGDEGVEMVELGMAGEVVEEEAGEEEERRRVAAEKRGSEGEGERDEAR
jgi:hypothetical protein